MEPTDFSLKALHDDWKIKRNSWLCQCLKRMHPEEEFAEDEAAIAEALEKHEYCLVLLDDPSYTKRVIYLVRKKVSIPTQVGSDFKGYLASNYLARLELECHFGSFQENVHNNN